MEQQKKKFTKEDSDRAHLARSKRREKEKKKKEKSLEKLKALRKAQEREKEYKEYKKNVPAGLNQTIVNAMLGLEEPKEEKPKEEKPKEKVLCLASPKKESVLGKKRRKKKKEKIRGKLNPLWTGLRSKLIEDRESECAFWILRIPPEFGPERVKERILQIKEEMEEKYNKLYAQGIEQIKKRYGSLVTALYKLNGMGPRMTLPPYVPPADKLMYLGGAYKKIKEKEEKEEKEGKEKKEEQEEQEEQEEEEEEEQEQEEQEEQEEEEENILNKLNLLKEEPKKEEPKKEEPKKEEPKKEEPKKEEPKKEEPKEEEESKSSEDGDSWQGRYKLKKLNIYH